jgi:CubicO group peptidase (beta-lactamase class C family)
MDIVRRTSALLLVGYLALSACGGGGGGGGDSAAPPSAPAQPPPTQQPPGPPVFPTTEWETATPADMNMTATKLDQARNYSLIGGGAGFVTRGGRVVYTWGDTGARSTLKSATKSIGGIALGLALDDRRLKLADTAHMYLSTVGVPPQSNAATGWLDQITILQLATHTAGFEKPGGFGRLLFEPGTTWLYSDGGANWLADVLTQVYAEDLNSVLFSRVFSTIGITNDMLIWRDNASRTDKLNGVKRREISSGIEANVDAMARIGYLFLRGGVWNGQRVLSDSFVELVHTPQPQSAAATNADPEHDPTATQNYGVLWWTNSSGEMPGVPRDAYWAWGLGDNLIVVIPSLDLVIARTGNDPDDSSLPQLRTERNSDYAVLEPLLTPIVESVTDD